MAKKKTERSRLNGLIWLVFVLLLFWIRFPSPWLVAACGALLTACVAPGVLAARRRVTRLIRVRGGARRIGKSLCSRDALGMALLLLAVGIAGAAQHLSGRYTPAQWTSYWSTERERLSGVLSTQFDALADALETSVHRIASSVDEGPGARTRALREAVGRDQIASAAVFAPSGELVDWAGSHHDVVPAGIRSGQRKVVFAGTPVFRYLYYSMPLEGAGAAMAAALVEARIEPQLADDYRGFAARFTARTGAEIEITPRRPGRSGALASARFAAPPFQAELPEPDPGARRIELFRGFDLILYPILAVAWVLFFSRPLGPRLWVGMGVALFGGLVVPLDHAFLPEALSRPLEDLAWSPVRLFALAVIVLPLAALLSPLRKYRIGLWAPPLLALATYPLAALGVEALGRTELIGRSTAVWIGFQTVCAIIVCVLTMLLLSARPLESKSKRRRSRRALATSAGFIGCAACGLAVAAAGRTSPGEASALMAALWAAPAFFFGYAASQGGRLSFTYWIASAFMAATMTAAFGWSDRTRARLEIASRSLEELGTEESGERERLYSDFAERVRGEDVRETPAADLLYSAWTDSEYAKAETPLHLSLWSPEGEQLSDLFLNVAGEGPDAFAALALDFRRADGPQLLALKTPEIDYLFSVPLPGGRAVTGVAPPRRTLRTGASIAPLFAPLTAARADFLSLAPLPRRGAAHREDPPEIGEVRWSRNAEGWQLETTVAFPEGPYAVTHTISIANWAVMIARAILVLLPPILVVAALWLPSALALGRRPGILVDMRPLFGSFRWRLTWTLFAVLALSNLVFAIAAGRALDGAAERTARMMGERALGQIVRATEEEGEAPSDSDQSTGSVLLVYQDAELATGSSGQLAQLGIYDSWVQRDAYLELANGAALTTSAVRDLGTAKYVVVHRALPDGDIVAAPVPLRAGASALRRNDIIHLLGAALVLGPLVSLVFALWMGRMLTRPITKLQTASARVGRGNLAVRLPEERADEFGTVFREFNDMVIRLDEARRELVRGSRRTRTIVEESPSGVIALDRHGRVAIANPEASAQLGAPLAEGAPLPTDAPFAKEFAAWTNAALAARDAEAARDFRRDGRRVRARGRLIAPGGSFQGMVVHLEDVTDELRSERILAWGEMAKQVAHEVKTPLTPIKLSVQHLLRAWSDGGARFGEVLRRNAGAVLAEIDRLNRIAGNFSRFAAPGGATGGRAGPIDVAEAVRAVVELYHGGGDSEIQVELVVEPRLAPMIAVADELKEVLINLIENSRNAMPEGGKVFVRAGADEEGRGYVEVEDEGVGIEPELLDRITDPHFSTRSKGAGLGLAISSRLAASWGGSLIVSSELGEGTLVRVRLLLCDEGEAG